ncbi:DUF6088 family protein [Cloacibacillus evryensis]|uniref:DUF6088 family protein n=1 Tax=Cloacibacillus evryensis TaxID=508460 RepID=UPI0026E07831|nr:DUF6088 family protein [Cloacibacillus evryensis]
MIWDYIAANYEENQPILAAQLRKASGVPSNNLRQNLKFLTDKGKLKRFDNGVYYIPGRSRLKSGAALSPSRVAEAKYIMQDGCVCGYYAGLKFANMLGITTQVPNVVEIVSNNASAKLRTVEMRGIRILLRKTRAVITSENYLALQFLDMLTTAEAYSELSEDRLYSLLKEYIKKTGITSGMISNYIGAFPDRVARILIEKRLFNVFA